jgi:hypothetical protein
MSLRLLLPRMGTETLLREPLRKRTETREPLRKKNVRQEKREKRQREMLNLREKLLREILREGLPAVVEAMKSILA